MTDTGPYRIDGPLPRGWYRLGPIDADGVQAFAGPGHTLAWWVRPATPNDPLDVIAVDSVCPHLGADLRLGTVDESGRSITCMFHGLEFEPCPPDAAGDGCDGSTPCLARRPTAVVHGLAYAFLGGQTPAAPPMDFSGREPTAPPDVETHHSATLDAHQLIVIEGDFDPAHFAPVHGLDVTYGDAVFDADTARVDYTLHAHRPYHASIAFDGVTRRHEVVVAGPVTLAIRSEYRSIGRRQCHADVTIRIWAPTPTLAERANTAFLRELDAQVEHDAAIWRTRFLDEPSQLQPTDDALRRYRDWVERFMP